MATTEGAAPPEAAGVFLPDAQAIARLANAFFKGVNGGAPMAPPATPTSAPAPWTPPAPAIATVAQAIPVQPPFGAPDPIAASLPASAPFRSFGGASAGSATPLAPFASRALLPAAAQTLVSPPRVDPAALAPFGAPESISPFATEIDLRAALAALSADYQAPRAPSIAAPPPATPAGPQDSYSFLNRDNPVAPAAPP